MSAQAPGRARQAFTDIVPTEQKQPPKKPARQRNPLLTITIRLVMNNDDVQKMHEVRQHRRHRMKRLDTGQADALDKLMKQLKITEGKK